MAGTDTPAVERLVLYDGSCGLCDRSVQWLLRKDRTRRLHFAPLTGITAAAVLARHPDIPRDLDSLLYVDGSDGSEHVTWYAEAVFQLCAAIGVEPFAIRLARRLPRGLADAGYRAVARVRHRVSGGRIACRALSPADRARFLP